MATSSTVLTVGVGKQFKTIATAIAAAHDGDTIDVDAGTYTDDTAIITKKLTIEAVGGLVVMNQTHPPSNGKGLLVVNADLTISGFSFRGAQVSNAAGGNGAGIRYQAGNLTLINDQFLGNQNGLLATPFVAGTGSIDIEGSQFGNNGTGTGFTHNMYIGQVASFTLNDSYSYGANGGHEVKSLAYVNDITNNRIQDNNSTSSYSIDLPYGGVSTIANNLIEQGANSGNPIIISYAENAGYYANSSLNVENNIVVNDETRSLSSIVMVQNDDPNVTAMLQNNSTWGLTASQLTRGPATVSGEQTLASRPTAALNSSYPAGDKPTIAGMPQSEAVPDSAQATPLASVVIGNPNNPVEQLRAVVSLSGAVGTLLGDGGAASPDGLTFTTQIDTAANVDQLLRGVNFIPKAGPFDQSAKLTVTVTNESGNSATASVPITSKTLGAPPGMNFVFFSTANDSVTAPNLGLGNVYVETAAVIGHDVITGFNPAADILELSHSAFGTVANVLAVTSTVSGGALITINSGASIALPGVAPSTLNAQNIQLV